jgi:hypothetical protein
MTHWPQAPRLGSALAERVASIGEIDVDHAWQQLNMRLDDVASEAPHDLLLDPHDQRRSSGPASQRRPATLLGLAACIVALVIAIGYVARPDNIPPSHPLGATDPTDPADTANATATPTSTYPSRSSIATSIPITSDVPAPSNRTLPLADCTGFPQQPARYSVDVDGDSVEATISQGAAVPGLAGPVVMWFVVGDDAIANAVADQLIPPGDGRLTAHISNNALSTTQLEAVVLGVLESTCPLVGAPYLIATGESARGMLTADQTCSSNSEVAFAAYAIVGEIGPAPSCLPRRPVLLIEPAASGDSRADWASSLGCTEPTERADSANNVTTTWMHCDVTLHHVALAHDLGSTTTIDGRPMTDIITDITAIPN